MRYLFRIPPVLKRCDPELFFKCRLEMALTGEAQIAADQTQGFGGVSKEIARFLQAAAGNKLTDGEPELLFKIG